MSTAIVRFEPSTEADRSFFVHVHHASYRAVIEEMFGWDENLQDDFANSAFDAGGIQLILLNSKRIGVFGLDLVSDCLWLKELFILPTMQNQGVGSLVINHAIKQSFELEKELRLRTLKVNFAAKRLYERHGFKVITETDDHWILSRLTDD